MKYERIEVRLDADHVRKVSELKAKYGTSTSELVREAIDQAYEKMMLERRLQAVRQLAEANLWDSPDPEELKRQILEGYDLPDLD